MKTWILLDKGIGVYTALIGWWKFKFLKNLIGQDHYFALKILKLFKLKKDVDRKKLKKKLSFAKN